MNKNIKKYLLLFIVLTLFLISCNSKSDNLEASVPVEKTLATFFQTLKSGDLNSASEYLDKVSGDYNTSLKFQSSFQQDIVKKVFSKLDYKILSTSVRENTAKVNIEITSLDTSSIYNDIMSKSSSSLIGAYFNGSEQEKISAKNEAKKIASNSINNAINSTNFPKTTNTIKLTLIEVDGKWLIKPDKDFISAITGKMPQLLSGVKNK